MSDTALILLASGLSKRFGRSNKLLANLDGKPVVAHVMDAAKTIKFAQRFAVIPIDEPELEQLVRSAGFEPVFNPQPESGQGQSLARGAKAVIAAGYERALVMLADMPFVTSSHLERLITHTGKADVIFSKTRNRLTPPAVFNAQALHRLTHMRGDKGARQMDLSDLEVQYIQITEHQAQDIDSPEDLS